MSMEAVIDQNAIMQESNKDISVEAAIAINKQIEINPTDTPFDIRCKIKTLEYAIKKFIDIYKLEAIDLPVQHTINNGVYIRQCYHPAGILVIGKIYKQKHVFWLLKGVLMLVSEDIGRKVYCGPCIIQFEAGTQKVGLALEDCIIATVHASKDETDIGKLEQMLYAENYSEVGKEDPIIDNSDLLNMTYERGK